jgi:DNA-binding NarL/FixJ family response regulator
MVSLVEPFAKEGDFLSSWEACRQAGYTGEGSGLISNGVGAKMQDFSLKNTGFPLFTSQHLFANVGEGTLLYQQESSNGQRRAFSVNPCRIIVADDHVLFRQGLKNLLGARSDLEVIGEAADGLQLLGLLNRSLPDIILLDISILNLRGIEAVREIRRAYPRVKILILTMHKDKQYLEQTIAAGARGYLLKEDTDTELFTAIEKIKRGRIYVSPNLLEELTEDWVQTLHDECKASPKIEQLTVREKEVLKLIAEGKGSKEIAELLCISIRTVERHRANIMEKLNLKKTADLVKYAIQKGYV